MFVTPKERVEEYTAKGWWGSTTLDDLVQRNRRELGDKPALIDPLNREALDGKAPRRLSWTQLGDEIDRVGAALLGLGLKKGRYPHLSDAKFHRHGGACARLRTHWRDHQPRRHRLS
ncbi:MAG: hypothetical protein NVV62_07785 [Terricaulis sp.]|nr:hypothetical protein [Terricaulis sp.]